MSFLKVSDNNNDPTQQALSRPSESTELKARVEQEGGAGASAAQAVRAVCEHTEAPQREVKLSDLIAAAQRDGKHGITEKNAIIDCTDCKAFTRIGCVELVNCTIIGELPPIAPLSYLLLIRCNIAPDQEQRLRAEHREAPLNMMKIEN